jgi:hypothetical protein
MTGRNGPTDRIGIKKTEKTRKIGRRRGKK